MEYLAISETFAEESFLKKLSVSRTGLEQLINPDEWEITASSMLPITRRLSCARILGAFRPLMNQIAPEPEEGWLSFVYQTAINHLYLRPDLTHTSLQQDAALCFLHVLRALLMRSAVFCPLISGWTLISAQRKNFSTAALPVNTASSCALSGKNMSMNCCVWAAK